ncbi:MAG: DoxX family protein [bacterium]|nr:DoxX family protein [bacterium]
MKKENIFGILRIVMGWIFLWPFLDKLFGLGYSTKSGKAWLDGVSPTAGFLKSAQGPFGNFFHSLAGNTAVDWLFMLGLLLVGSALILGIGVRIAAYSGSVMVILMWLASMPIKTNPIIDDHIVYLLVFLMLASVGAGQYLGLGNWWKKQKIVKKNSILE